MLINIDHALSISRERRAPQPPQRPRGIFERLAVLLIAAWAMPSLAARPSCIDALGSPVAVQGPLRVTGSESVDASLPVDGGATYLVRVEEHDNDALIELLDTGNQAIARADHPERRTGTRWIITTAGSPSLSVRATGKEHVRAAGTATVRVFDLAAL
ncbi:MAG TPA: hypothetical protein VMT66_14780, partial [Steroidobacteraceae bacterium]|nr:hypothetical protein [Steroidobacteraceae bacterium]